MTIEYKAVYENTIYSLQEEVNHYLQDGWTLYEGMTSSIINIHKGEDNYWYFETFYTQIMIREMP